MVDSEVVDDDCLLSLISIPPTIEGLEESTGVGPVCGSSLAAASRSPEPYAANSAELRRSNHVVSGDGLEGDIMSESELGVDLFKVS